MNERDGQKSPAAPRSPRVRRALLAVAAVAVLAAAAVLYDYIRINLWLESDAGRIEGYAVPLIADHKEVAPQDHGRFAAIDRLLIAEMRKGRRNVVACSRSEIKFNLLHTRAYVKVFLETALPDQPEHRARLKIICVLKRNGPTWRLAGPPVEKTLE